MSSGSELELMEVMGATVEKLSWKPATKVKNNYLTDTNWSFPFSLVFPHL